MLITLFYCINNSAEPQKFFSTQSNSEQTDTAIEPEINQTERKMPEDFVLISGGTTTPFNTETSISAEECNYFGHFPYEIEDN